MGHFEGVLNDFLGAQAVGLSYREWQPTKWASLDVLRDRVSEIARASCHPIASALELGCGAATLLYMLAAAGADCHGVDRDGTALELARQAHASMGPTSGRFVLERANFLDPEWSAPPADLVFSIGTIEHYFGRDQEEVLRRHAEFSQRWVLLAIPNMSSPLFEAFLQAMVEDGTVYHDEHYSIDVPDLVRRAGFVLAASDGCHVFLSRARDRRFAGAELVSFESGLRNRLALDSVRYAGFPAMDLAAADITALARVEQATPMADRIRFGFLLWYLIDTRPRETP